MIFWIIQSNYFWKRKDLVLSDRFIFAESGWNSPVLRSFDQSPPAVPTLFHFDLEGKEEAWKVGEGDGKKVFREEILLEERERIDACLRCTDASSSPRFDRPFWRFPDIFWRIILPQMFPDTDRPFSRSMLRSKRDNLSWPLSTLEIKANPGGYLEKWPLPLLN